MHPIESFHFVRIFIRTFVRSFVRSIVQTKYYKIKTLKSNTILFMFFFLKIKIRKNCARTYSIYTVHAKHVTQ